MAVRIWGGSVSGDISVAGNWVGGTAPTSTDDCVFDTPGAYAPLTGTLANTGTCVVTDRFVHGFGDGSTYPTFGALSYMSILGRGATYKFASSGTIGKIDANLNASQTLIITSGTVTNLTQMRGRFLQTGSTITNFRAVELSEWWADSGTAVTLFRGRVLKAVLTSRDITTAHVYRGSRFQFLGTGKPVTSHWADDTEYADRSTGVATTVNLDGSGARYTIAGNPNGPAQSKAITFNVMTGAKVIYSEGGASITGYTLNQFGLEKYNNTSGGVPSVQP